MTSTDSSSDNQMSYSDWLLSHTDDQLTALLWRLSSEEFPADREFSNTPITNIFSPHVLDRHGMHQLTAIQLLMLHAGREVDASRHWVTVKDIVGVVGELMDIAGTPEEYRPTTEDILQALADCASWGLVYGNDWSLSGEVPAAANGKDADLSKILLGLPTHLAKMFQPSTAQLWRLADCNRCNIPTAELPAKVEALPARQRQLLETLANGGGVGQSESLHPDADPDQPLPELVREGILDQLDENTARLTGRVWQYLRGSVVAEPGGDFRPVIVPDEPQPAEEKIDATAIANAVQTIQDLTDVLEEVGRQPMRPLVAGGIGTREMNKVARRLDTTSEEIERRLTLAYETRMLSMDVAFPGSSTDPVWAPTNKAMEFIDAPLHKQWAMLITGWLKSPYSPWLTEEEEARSFQDVLDSNGGAGLRHIFPYLFETPSTPTSALPHELWRVRPHEAWRTREDQLDIIVDESIDLGLTAMGQPSTALFVIQDLLNSTSEHPKAIAGKTVREEMAARLAPLLPEPVEELIIQGDHTITAPGLLAPEDAAQLRRMAVQESTGMASVWRVTKESLKQAFEQGDAPTKIMDFLKRMSPGGLDSVPQSIKYLIDDAYRGSTMAIAGTATSYILAHDEVTVDAILALSDVGSLQLRKIAPTVLISKAQLSHVTDKLESQGIRLQLEGGSVKVTAPVMHRVPTPGEEDPTTPEIRESLRGAVQGFRRAQTAEDESEDGSMAIFSEPSDILGALRRAFNNGTEVRVSHVNADGEARSDWITLITMDPSSVAALTRGDEERVTIHPHRIATVEVPKNKKKKI